MLLASHFLDRKNEETRLTLDAFEIKDW